MIAFDGFRRPKRGIVLGAGASDCGVDCIVSIEQLLYELVTDAARSSYNEPCLGDCCSRCHCKNLVYHGLCIWIPDYHQQGKTVWLSPRRYMYMYLRRRPKQTALTKRHGD